ncbi:energy transducer TonB [Balneola vulgaris]|jgi:protein TonB|uniref:energy transducer TonB n=1 Tax=Balneola vulgaris TaxID=287535 RepID=UPI0003825EE5|nr:energy transducer TonB [Balneola vulgaris]
MINRRKDAKVDLKRSYNVYLEVGMIIALGFMIAAVKINLYSPPPEPPPIEEQEEVVMEEAIQTKQVETPPPPPRPPVPVEVPNDEVIEDEIIDIAEFDVDGPLDLPPPPPPAEEEEEEVFIIVENMPELIGGMAKLQGRVKYPPAAIRAGIEGRVTVQFVVNEKGEVVNPRVVRGIGGGCDEEALRVVKQSKFKPGSQRGRPVQVQMSLPILFKLTN